MKTFCKDYTEIKFVDENKYVQTYTAINSITNKNTILKFFDIEYYNENLRNNIDILKQIDNNNFINIKANGSYEEDGKTGCYVETEIFESKSLSESIKITQYSLVESMKIVKSVAEGIKELNFKDLIFKNLSCDNIYINTEGKVKIDILTCLYKENLQKNETELNVQYEINSLGIILYQLITNQMDFIIEKIKYCIEDKHLLLIINKCTNNQYDRYEELDYFIKDLNTYIEKCSKPYFKHKNLDYIKKESTNPYIFQPLKVIKNLCICVLVFLMIATVLNGGTIFKLKSKKLNNTNISTSTQFKKQIAKNTKKENVKEKTEIKE